MKIVKRNDKRYPYGVDTDGRRILIPQQKEFGTFCRAHGCSMAACSIALQFLGIKQKDKTVWNPEEIYKKAKKIVPGFNGSKLTIWGCKTVINKIAGRECAFWYSNNGNHNRAIVTRINNALKAGNVVLFEENDPVHTVVLLGIDTRERWITATNGRIVRRQPAVEIKKALHGAAGSVNQRNWWNGKEHGAGFVIIKG